MHNNAIYVTHFLHEINFTKLTTWYVYYWEEALLLFLWSCPKILFHKMYTNKKIRPYFHAIRWKMKTTKPFFSFWILTRKWLPKINKMNVLTFFRPLSSRNGTGFTQTRCSSALKGFKTHVMGATLRPFTT